MTYKLSFFSVLIGLSIISVTIHAMPGPNRSNYQPINVRDDEFRQDSNGITRSQEERIVLGALRDQNVPNLDNVKMQVCSISLPGLPQGVLVCVGDRDYYALITNQGSCPLTRVVLLMTNPRIFSGDGLPKDNNEYAFNAWDRIFSILSSR